MIRTSLLASLVLAILFTGLVVAPSANAQSGQSSGFGVGNIHKGLVVGTIVAVVAVVGVTVTYLALHNRGVVVGCITESGEKGTLVGSDRVVYLLAETGPKLPAGERAKLKGHKSGQPSSRSFQVEKVLKDYGRCST